MYIFSFFFVDSFETTSAALSFLLFELSQRPDIQQRLRSELQTALEETGTDLTYDFILNHTYLDMVISECLRLYPVGQGWAFLEKFIEIIILFLSLLLLVLY